VLLITLINTRNMAVIFITTVVAVAIVAVVNSVSILLAVNRCVLLWLMWVCVFVIIGISRQMSYSTFYQNLSDAEYEEFMRVCWCCLAESRDTCWVAYFSITLITANICCIFVGGWWHLCSYRSIRGMIKLLVKNKDWLIERLMPWYNAVPAWCIVFSLP